MEIPASRKNTTLPNQRVSLKTKQTSQWTKDMADYIINLAISCNDKTKTKTYLDMANGVVDKSMYEYVLKSWRNNWSELSTFFKYTPEIRKIMYTTNIVKSLHMQLRKVSKSSRR